MKSNQVLENLKKKYAHEPEFIQAVEELLEDIAAMYDNHDKYQAVNVLSRITEPDRVFSFRVNWEDDKGNVQVNRGWRVQFNNALGPYKGGLRFHPTVNPSVLKFLGFEQIFKNALTGLPMGGAKGGSDFDPKGKSDSEIRRFCYAFMRELAPFIGSDTDVPAGDIGVGGREINYMFAMYKNLTREWTGVLTGKGVGHGGSLIRTEATGYGLVYFLDNMLKTDNDCLTGKTVLISGAGNVATYAAKKVTELGGIVVTLSDSTGTLYDKNGLTQEKIDWVIEQKANRKALKDYVKAFGGEWIESSRPWHIKADIALPCATQNEINGDDAKNLVKNGVKYVAEGANMPSDADAIGIFQKNGVKYAPGKASNAGGVAVSGLEMSQNSVRQYSTFAQLDHQLQDTMKNIHEACVQYGKTDDGQIDYKKGANIAGFSRVADALVNYGTL
ncbi:glutamate dehydrogenase [Moraxella macacae 0408225]|uniref:Glutamate dehydrogenase n=2 Tax=Pseudomonadota TaxID=1224 RepID=L2F5C1_9GAMM|nr:NADP-specific glutamate dehydrogenase [Moraxella macacae]ELA08070.1 glutamate dehydrogenase [Moraxella macacae 0408225]